MQKCKALTYFSGILQARLAAHCPLAPPNRLQQAGAYRTGGTLRKDKQSGHPSPELAAHVAESHLVKSLSPTR